MVRIRLSRGGAKKKAYYHIVVIDKRDKRDGKCIERLGSYDPALETQDRIKINHERLDYWIAKGAQISDRVKYLRKYALDADNLKKREKHFFSDNMILIFKFMVMVGLNLFGRVEYYLMDI